MPGPRRMFSTHALALRERPPRPRFGGSTCEGDQGLGCRRGRRGHPCQAHPIATSTEAAQSRTTHKRPRRTQTPWNGARELHISRDRRAGRACATKQAKPRLCGGGASKIPERPAKRQGARTSRNASPPGFKRTRPHALRRHADDTTRELRTHHERRRRPQIQRYLALALE